MAEDEDEDENKMFVEEINFFPITSQTNVYGLSTLRSSRNRYNKVLLACLRGNIMCVTPPQSGRPSSLSSHNLSTRTLQGVDIVCIDVFHCDGRFHLGVVYIKDGHTSIEKKYLSIYSGTETIKPESMLDNCQTLELDFVPFQLSHSNSIIEEQTVFMLSGGDGKIHVFKQDSEMEQFIECKTENNFPEFQNVPGNVIWMDIYNDLSKQRCIISFACQNGVLKVVLIEGNEIKREWLSTHDGPISSVKLFTFEARQNDISNEMKALPSMRHTRNEDDVTVKEDSSIYLLVTGVIEPSVIYEDLLNNGLNQLSVLPHSDQYDCVICSHVSDVTWDGKNEILLGTYGQELLVYKLRSDDNETMNGRLKPYLFWSKNFAYPIYAIDYLDLTNDGVRELIIASSKGLHIMQHQFSGISKRFQEEFSN